MKNRKTKTALWITAGGLGAAAAVVALAFLGLPHRGVSGIHVTGVRIVERPDRGAVLAWTGGNGAGTSCRYAARLGGPATHELPRGSFTAHTELAPPHAIAWLRVECDDDSIQIPWDMSETGPPEATRAPTENGGRVEVARVLVTAGEARRIAANMIRQELSDVARVTRVGKVTLHAFSVGSDHQSVWTRLRATAEVDISWTPCNRVHIDGYIGWARDGLEPRRAIVQVDLSDTWRSTRWLCGLTKAVASKTIREAQRDASQALLRPVGEAVWQWLLGDGAADSKVAGQLREILARGGIRVSALTRGGRIDVRVTADEEWLGPGTVALGSAASLGNGRAAWGAVSYSLVNKLLGAFSFTELRDLGLAGSNGGVVGDAVAIVDQAASKLAEEMDLRIGRGARIDVADDLGFRLPLAVGPDGEYGVHLYLKGADVVRDGSGTGRYAMWAHARTRLACPTASEDQSDPDVQDRSNSMRRGIAVTASPIGGSASADLAARAGRVLRAEQAGVRNLDPLSSLRTHVARYCVVRTPLQIGHGLRIDALRNDPARNAVVASVGGAGAW